MSNDRKSLALRVKALRKQKGLSQEELARRVGISRSALSQLESSARRVTTEELVKLSRELNVAPGVLLGTETEPEVFVARDARPATPGPRLRISVPQKNLAKFKEVLLYILSRVGCRSNIGETAIYKLLYFIDFDYYEKYEEQLIGATYIRNKYGPTPVEFAKIVRDMEQRGELTRAEGKYFRYPQRKYLPLREPDLSVITGQEKALIDDVLCRLADMNAAQISDYSHGDVPWRATAEGKAIPYEAVFYRTAPYAHRVYPEQSGRGVLQAYQERAARLTFADIGPAADRVREQERIFHAFGRLRKRANAASLRTDR
jgi:transcriptional regulator with XRE-family HTH domain